MQAKVLPNLCFAQGHPELESNLRWLPLVLGLEIPRCSQAVNLGSLLLVLGLGPLSKRYKGWGLMEASCCLFERI